MPIVYKNPFAGVGAQFSSGLDYVIANYTAAVGFDGLNTIVVGYIQTLQDPSTIPPSTLKPLIADLALSVVPNSVNDYVNKQIDQNLAVNAAQMALIDSIFDGIKNNSIDCLDDYFDGVDELISTSDCLSTIDKTSLYIASAIARASYDYWIAQITGLTPITWGPFLNANTAIAYANIPTYVAASFTAALSGFAQGQASAMAVAGVLNDAGRFLGSPLSIGAALGVTSGKIIFQWAQRPNQVC